MVQWYLGMTPSGPFAPLGEVIFEKRVSRYATATARYGETFCFLASLATCLQI